MNVENKELQVFLDDLVSDLKHLDSEEMTRFDEWHEVGDLDINVCGSYWSSTAPENGVAVYVYAGPIPEAGMFPNPTETFTLEIK